MAIGKRQAIEVAIIAGTFGGVSVIARDYTNSMNQGWLIGAIVAALLWAVFWFWSHIRQRN